MNNKTNSKPAPKSRPRSRKWIALSPTQRALLGRILDVQRAHTSAELANWGLRSAVTTTRRGVALGCFRFRWATLNALERGGYITTQRVVRSDSVYQGYAFGRLGGTRTHHYIDGTVCLTLAGRELLRS